MFGAFDISTSGLTAQRTRLDVIASNLANVDSVLDPSGRPSAYRRMYANFQPQRLDGGEGVSVASIQQDFETPFLIKHEPGNKAADHDGNVRYPNVDLSTEYVNALETTRAYEANITAVETTKSMMTSTLRILA